MDAFLFTWEANLRVWRADEKEGTSVKRRGRPRKKCNIEGKKLFDERDSSEEEDSISSDHGPQEQE